MTFSRTWRNLFSKSRRLLLLALSTSSIGTVSIDAPAFAASSDNNGTLTWSRCIDLVVQNNADLIAGRANVRSAEQQITSTLGDYTPGIYGEYDYGQTSTDGEITNGSTGTLGVAENLFNGFKTTFTLHQNRANVALQRSTFQITKASVSAELITAYEGLQYAKSYKKLTESIIKRREENLRLVTLRFESGGENKGSVLLSSANLEQAKFDDLQAANAAVLAQRQLAKVMGLDDHAEFAIQEEVPQHDPDAAPDIQSLALATPDYMSAKANADVGQAAIGLSRQGFYPQVNLIGNVARAGTEIVPVDTASGYFGVQVKLNFFNPFGTYFGERVAIETYRGLESTRISVSRYLLVKLEQSYEGFIEGVAKFKVATAFKEAAGVRAEIARAKYKNGLITFDDWDIIENDLIQREKDFVSSQRDRVIAESTWNQAQGKGVF